MATFQVDPGGGLRVFFDDTNPNDTLYLNEQHLTNYINITIYGNDFDNKIVVKPTASFDPDNFHTGSVTQLDSIVNVRFGTGLGNDHVDFYLDEFMPDGSNEFGHITFSHGAKPGYASEQEFVNPNSTLSIITDESIHLAEKGTISGQDDYQPGTGQTYTANGFLYQPETQIYYSSPTYDYVTQPSGLHLQSYLDLRFTRNDGADKTISPTETPGVAENGSGILLTLVNYAGFGGPGSSPAVTIVNPCFTRGTLIEAKQGLVAVEDIKIGDEILTVEGGYSPVKWVGFRKVSPAQMMVDSKVQPVRIKANTFGKHDEITLSPQHRVLIDNAFSELLFGSEQVLVAAKHLINGDTVDYVDSPLGIEYYHIMFDGHQVIHANGLPAESLFFSFDKFDESMREEFIAIFGDDAFNDFDAGDKKAHSPVINRHEAAILNAYI